MQAALGQGRAKMTLRASGGLTLSMYLLSTAETTDVEQLPPLVVNTGIKLHCPLWW